MSQIFRFSPELPQPITTDCFRPMYFGMQKYYFVDILWTLETYLICRLDLTGWVEVYIYKVKTGKQWSIRMYVVWPFRTSQCSKNTKGGFLFWKPDRVTPTTCSDWDVIYYLQKQDAYLSNKAFINNKTVSTPNGSSTTKSVWQINNEK